MASKSSKKRKRTYKPKAKTTTRTTPQKTAARAQERKIPDKVTEPKKQIRRTKTPKESLPLTIGIKNLIVLIIAVVVMIIGWVLLAKGSMTLAPLLLIISYCILVPISIMIGLRKNGNLSGKPKETDIRQEQ